MYYVMIQADDLVLKDLYFNTWIDLYNYIYNFKKNKLNNIRIDVFKNIDPTDPDDGFQYVGDFMQVKMASPGTEAEKQTEKKNHKILKKAIKIILYIIILILTFIISFITSITKK